MTISASMKTDPIGSLLERADDSAQIIPDPINGYDRVIPASDVLEDMTAMYCSAMEQADIDYKPVHEEMTRNERAYETLSDAGETITVPVCKRITNQQVAWISTAILSKAPYISVRPIDGGTYEVPSELVDEAPVPGQEQQGAQPVMQTAKLTSEDAATLYETFLQYKLKECVEFEQLVEDTAFSMHIGENPTWWKVSYDPQVRFAKQRKWIQQPNSNLVQILGVEDTNIKAGESVNIAHISGRNITMPIDETDEQTASWLCEKTPMSSLEIWQAIKDQRFDFCQDGEPDIEDIKTVLGFAENLSERDVAKQSAEVDLRVAADPQKKHDTRTLYFFYPIKRSIGGSGEPAQDATAPLDSLPPDLPQGDQSPDQPIESVDQPFDAPQSPDAPPTDDGPDAAYAAAPEPQQTVIEIRSLCATVHVKAKKILNLYVNPYWHGKRPYVPFFMRKRPHRFSGMSTTGDVAPLQRLISSIFHAQIQNMVQQNVKVFLIRNNSTTWRFLTQTGNQLRPGIKIPFDDPSDVSPVQLGSPVQSMASEISFLDGQAQQLSVTSDYDLGADIPNRTAAATVSQIEQMAKVQPQTILRGMRRCISKAMEMYLQTVAQFHVYETIPFLDTKTQKLTRLLIGFPKETIENHFAFYVTATGDEDTPQAKIEKTTILLGATDQRNIAVMNLSNIIMAPEVPDAAVEIAIHLLVGREKLYGDLLSAQRVDSKQFVLSEKMIRGLRAQIKSQYQPPPPPPPPKPEVRISLSGQLNPVEVNEAAQAAGIQVPPPQQGAMNGPPQLPPPGPGGDVPPVPPGQPGPQFSPGEPGNAGMAQPGPQDALLAGGAPV